MASSVPVLDLGTLATIEYISYIILQMINILKPKHQNRNFTIINRKLSCYQAHLSVFVFSTFQGRGGVSVGAVGTIAPTNSYKSPLMHISCT